MKRSLLFFVLFLAYFDMSAQNAFKTPLDSVSYSIGLSIAQNIKKGGFFETINADMVALAIKTVFEGKQPLLSEQQANTVISNHVNAMQTKKYGAVIEKGKKFLEENKKQAGVIALPSGLQFKVLKDGTGATPKLTDKVTTHYMGKTLDGKVFDSSYERKEPVTFDVRGVIAGWTEALQMMKVGSKWELYIPYNLAYGEQGASGAIGPFETLVFEVELLNVVSQ